MNDKDLSTQLNYRMHMNIRRMVGERKHHHKRSKKLNKVCIIQYFFKALIGPVKSVVDHH